LTLRTLIASACESEPPLPSETCTVRSYTLFVPTSLGNSKLGALRKVRAPLAGSIAKLAASAPPDFA
jgi:hypothetical protein